MEKELYPGHAEELRQRADKVARIDRAQSAVLPGALKIAFGTDGTAEVDCGPDASGAATKYKLQPVTLGLTTNLENIGSPLLETVRIMREELARNHERSPEEKLTNDAVMADVHKKLSALKFHGEQIAETIFIFVTPARKVRELLDDGRGASRLREAAMAEIGDKLHPAIIARLQHACVQHYVQSFATIIAYGVPPPEGGGINFQVPSPSEATGSAGG